MITIVIILIIISVVSIFHHFLFIIMALIYFHFNSCVVISNVIYVLISIIFPIYITLLLLLASRDKFREGLLDSLEVAASG